jgi:hypothetical protein
MERKEISKRPMNQFQEYDGTSSPKDRIIVGNYQINGEKWADLIWLRI